VGWEKVARWSTKAAISLKRVKIEEIYYGAPIGSNQRSFQRYHSRPLRPPLPQDWGSQPLPKTPIAIIPGTGKATYFKFGQNNNRVHPNKSPLKLLGEKGAWAYTGTVPIFWVPLLSQERVKLRV